MTPRAHAAWAGAIAGATLSWCALRLEWLALAGVRPGPKAALALLPDLGLGLTLLAVAGGQRPARRLAVTLAALGLATAVIGQQYLAHTGTPLHLGLLAYAARRAGALTGLLATAFDRGLLLRLALALIPALGLAALARRQARPAPRLRRPAALLGGALLACGAWLAPPPSPRAPLALAPLLPAPRLHAATAGDAAPFTYEPPRPLTPPPSDAPDVLIVILESTRADLLRPWGPPEAASVTPHLSGLSTRAVVVDRTYVTTSHTSKALVGLLCGAPPDPGLAVVAPQHLPLRCLPELLAAGGVHTGFFQSALGTFEERRELVARMGFDRIITQEDLDADRFATVGYVAMDERALIDPVVDFFAEDPERPHLAVVLTSVPHHPYETPEPPPPGAEPGSELAYAAAVHHVDAALAELDAALDGRPAARPRVTLYIADHGEAFGEHGPRQHDGVPYEEVVHVPWLMVGPPERIGPPRRLGGLRSQLDLLPTVLEILGVPTAGALPGRSVLSGDPHPRLVTRCWFEGSCAAVIEGPRAFVLLGERAQAFDLAQDPAQLAPEPLPAPARARVAGVVAAWEQAAKALHARPEPPRANRPPPPPARPPRRRPQCMRACVADVDPAAPGTQVACTVTQIAQDGARLPIPPCPPDGPIPAPAPACFIPRTDEDLAPECAAAGFNLELAIRRRLPAPPGAVLDVRCKLAPDPSVCLPGPPAAGPPG